MKRKTALVALCISLVTPVAAAEAQSLATRITGADGKVEFTYAARADACGNGADMIRLGQFMTVNGSYMSGGTSAPCQPGPARVLLTVTGGAVSTVRVRVGNARSAGEGRNLGIVSAAEAASLMLSLASRLPERQSRSAIIAAALADSAVVWRDLLALGRSRTADEKTRRSAMHWLGAVAPPEAVPEIAAAMRDVSLSYSVREGAIGALARLQGGAGVTVLVAVARGADRAVTEPKLRAIATFWLGEADRTRARPVLRELASSDTVNGDVRQQAIFALGHLNPEREDGVFLRALYRKLPDVSSLHDQVVMGVAQMEDPEGLRWLLALTTDAGEGLESRKRALFWAGQQERITDAELIAIYPRLDGRELRKHYAFVLSQRTSDAAVDGLIAMARTDTDSAVRSQAIFWLGQSRHTRARRYLTEVLER